MITVTVRFFAVARERAGTSVERIELDEPATVAHLNEVLAAQFPALGPLMKHLRVAVDHEIASTLTVLRDGIEVALIPPVSGG